MSKPTPKRSSVARTRSRIELDAAHADRLGVGGVDPLGGDLLGELGDVVAAVAVLGRLPAGHPGRDREREALDLAAGVVDVVLAPDLVADRLEQPHEGVAVGGVAAAADVQRAGRVGGDELDQDPLGEAVGAGPRSSPDSARRCHRAPVPGVGEEEVDEAGAGDLDPLDAAALAAELGARARRRAARRRRAGFRRAARRAASPRWSCSRRARASAAGRATARGRRARLRAGRGCALADRRRSSAIESVLIGTSVHASSGPSYEESGGRVR